MENTKLESYLDRRRRRFGSTWVAIEVTTSGKGAGEIVVIDASDENRSMVVGPAFFDRRDK